MKTELNGFFVGCNDRIWTKVVRDLGRSGVHFDYVSGMSENLKELDFLKQTVLHDTNSAYRGRFPSEVDLTECIIDELVLNQYQHAEQICMDLADRDDQTYSFSYQERQRLYITVLGFWLTAVRRYKPQFIIFPSTPHTVYDHVLYHVAKQNNIPMLMFLSISALKRILPFYDYQSPNAEVLTRYQACLSGKVSDWTLSGDIQDYVAKYEESYEKVMPSYLKKRLDAAQSKNAKQKLSWAVNKLSDLNAYGRYSSSIKAHLKTYQRKISQYFVPVAPINYLKLPFQAMERTDGLNGRQWQRYKRWAAQYKTQLKQQHDSHVQPFNSDRKYIYVPLQFQPERTSTPEGGRYSNQLLVLRMLSACVPDDWDIVVKENPSQLLPNTMHGERGRYAYYYEDLTAIKKVKLVSLETNQFSLIDNAQAIATLTGTTGWEALMRAKPVLSFGYAWYNGCEGVLPTRDLTACRAAIKQLRQGVHVDQNKVHCYLSAIDSLSFSGFLNIKRFESQQQGIDNNAPKLLSVINKFIAKKVVS